MLRPRVLIEQTPNSPARRGRSHATHVLLIAAFCLLRIPSLILSSIISTLRTEWIMNDFQKVLCVCFACGGPRLRLRRGHRIGFCLFDRVCRHPFPTLQTNLQFCRKYYVIIMQIRSIEKVLYRCLLNFASYKNNILFKLPDWRTVV